MPIPFFPAENLDIRRHLIEGAGRQSKRCFHDNLHTLFFKQLLLSLVFS